MAKAILRKGKVTLKVMVPVVIAALCIYGWNAVRAAYAQDEVIQPPPGPVVEVAEPNKTEIISARDQNSRLWEVRKWETVINPKTKEPNLVEVKSYIREKGCGICYMDEQNTWQITDTSWRRTATGFAMDRANYVLEIGELAGSFLTYSIDGKQLWLKPVSITADDGTNKYTIAQLNPASEGQIDANAPNRLIFINAFGEDIDLEIQAMPDGYHQNVVFYNKPQLPSGIDASRAKILLSTELGLDEYARSSPEKAAIEVCKKVWNTSTQSFSLTSNKIEIAALTDTGITKDDICFTLGEGNERFVSHRFAGSEIFQSRGDGVSAHLGVADKQLARGSDGKTHLIESLGVSTLENASYPVIWDYHNVNGTLNQNEEWYADATYHVTSAITVGDGNTLRIEPGTIVKFRYGTNNGINAGNGTLIAKGEPYSYIVFTSARDPNMGDTIDANAVGSGDWGGLSINSDSIVEFCKVGYSNNAIAAFLDESNGITIKNNILFSSYSSGINVVYTDNTTGTITIFNNLIFSGAYSDGIYCEAFGEADVDIDIYNNTVQSPRYGISTFADSSSTAIFNNLLVGSVTGIYRSSASENNNAFYSCTSPLSSGTPGVGDCNMTSSPFDTTTTALGRYFLNKNSNGGDLLKDGGSGNAAEWYSDPNQWSIYTVFDANHYFGSSTSLTTNTVWEPNYATCDSGAVAIGYHHPRVDYYIAPSQTVSLAAGVVLTVMPGTVVAIGSGSTLWGGKIISNGSPVNDAYIKYINRSLAHTGWAPIKYRQSTNGTIEATSSDSQLSFNEFTGLEYTMAMYISPHDNIFKWNLCGLYDTNSINCIFSENSIGICEEFGSDINITNCTFDRNTSYGLEIIEDSYTNAAVKNCIFSNNATAGINEMTMYEISSRLAENNNAFFLNGHHKIFWQSGLTTYPNPDDSDLYESSSPSIDDDDFYQDWNDFADRFYLPQPTGQNVHSRLVDHGDPTDSPMWGYTTDPNAINDPNVSRQDSNTRDIGYHYPMPVDTDSDGLYDYEEYWYGTDPCSVGDLPYITSFEEQQGFSEGMHVSDVNGWEISGQHTATITKASFTQDSNAFSYNYAAVGHDTILSKNFTAGGNTDNTYLRISCIPTHNLYIKVMNGSATVAALRFGNPSNVNDANIYILNGTAYNNTQMDYSHDANMCRSYLEDPDTYQGDPSYYDKCWLDFTFNFDWSGRTYDVNCFGSIENANLSGSFSTFTQVRFETGSDPNTFNLNRISVSGEAKGGGVTGDSNDVWVTAPAPNWTAPLKGHVPLYGRVWYDRLSRYEIKCCPTDLDSSEPNNWMPVCSGYNAVKDGVLGYWDTGCFNNGDYLLKIRVYDDVNQVKSEGIITRQVPCTGNAVYAQYPIIGRPTGQSFYYQVPSADITVPWPGTFPFEFRRSYSHAMRRYAAPMLFGWTHNHNIKLLESTATDWEVSSGQALVDSNGIGIGRLWLMMPAGTRGFRGHIDPNNSSQVIYTPLDNEADYIIRKTWQHSTTFDVNYTHYATNGMIMRFGRDNLSQELSCQGGIVGWSVFAGIGRQEDRFGNALIYDWTSVNGMPFYVNQISNNRTPAKLILSVGYPMPSGFYKTIGLSHGTQTKDVVTFSLYGLEGEADGLCYKIEIAGSTGNHVYHYKIIRNEWSLNSILSSLHYEGENGLEPWPSCWLAYNEDGSLQSRIDGMGDDTIGTENQFNYMARDYTYEYDSAGNLITHEKYYQICATGTTIYEYNRSPQGDSDDWHKEIITTTSPAGALLKQMFATRQVRTEQMNYSHMSGYPSWSGSIQPYYYLGGGGYTDTEYSYDDSRFPLKPTTILEYFDDDGDGTYERGPRKTTMHYDGRGNLDEQRVYGSSVDVNYVLTQLAYHPVYAFPTRKTTWQGYAAGDTPATSGAKVEQKWVFGNADGTENAYGAYLVREETLLDTIGTTANTSYKYYSTGNLNGKVKAVTDPEGRNTYYEYDACGFKEKVWQGAALDGSGDLVGTPTAQQRYYYDPDTGQLRLEADYLGSVKRYVGDLNSPNVYQIKEYHDTTAVSRPTFTPATYDSMQCLRMTTFEKYDTWGNCIRTLTPTGARIDKVFWPDGKTCVKMAVFEIGAAVNMYGEPWNLLATGEAECRSLVAMDGSPVQENTWSLNSDDHLINTGITSCRDSMDRVAHREELRSYWDWNYANDDPNQNMAHGTFTEYGYYGSGVKSYERVYHVSYDRDGWDPKYIDYLVSSFDIERDVHYYYDTFDRLKQCTEDPNTINRTTYYGYDAAGNRIYVIDPNGSIIFTDYDNANRKTVEYFALKPTTNPINITSEHANAKARQQTEYYKDGKVRAVISFDRDGTNILATSDYAYDARGRISDVNQSVDNQSANDARTVYDYNDAGFTRGGDPNRYQIRITDANSEQTWISQNEDGKVAKVLYPSGDYEKMVYDHNGIMVLKSVWNSSAQERQIAYTYDSFGKITRITYPDSGGWLDVIYTPTLWRMVYGVEKIHYAADHRAAADRPGDDGAAYTLIIDPLTGNTRQFKYGNSTSASDSNNYTIKYDYLATDPGGKKQVEVRDINDAVIYDVNYVYDSVGRLTTVKDDLADANIASFVYDKNGNRAQLKYWRKGIINGPNSVISYTYDIENQLRSIVADANGSRPSDPNYTFTATGTTDIDGLGRLKHAAELITVPRQGDRSHTLDYAYDQLSELTSSRITNVGAYTSLADTFEYYRDGNIYRHRKYIDDNLIPSATNYHSYTGDIIAAVTGSAPVTVGHDGNGNIWYTSGMTQLDIYNWDNKLAFAQRGSTTMQVKYDPMGNRVWKESYNGSATTTRKYIVDISGGLPTILCELDTSGSLKHSYFYADGQILAQQVSSIKYFYIHDRLGSIRLVVDANCVVKNSYTYNAFGADLSIADCNENVYNPFKYTGQWYDSEISQYYLRARMYDPQLMRFTGRDPVWGRFGEPLTLHKYLYCLNNPPNRTDPTGRISAAMIVVCGIVGGVSAAINSGCNEWSDASAIAGGIALGMFSGMLPNTAMGYLSGMVFSAANTAYSTWIGNGDMNHLGMNLVFGAAGSAAGGAVGALFQNAGAVGYLGGQGADMLYSWLLGQAYEGGENVVEGYTHYLEENQLEENQ